MRSSWSRLLTSPTVLWIPRLLWVATAIGGAWSIGDAVDGRSAALRWTVASCAWLLWGIGVVTLVVPSAFGLTIVRMVSALTAAVAVASWVGGSASGAAAVFLAVALLFATFVFGADFGQQCVQASAYGDERRFLLRAPAPFLIPVAISGIVWIVTLIGGPLLLASRRWIVGAAVTAIALAATWFVVPRFHLLSRRWVVLVPAGIVVHDHVVLAETLMVTQREIADARLALAGTEAADLTGPSGGHAVEIALTELVTATLAPTRSAPRGTAVHVRSFLVAPSRPGAFLDALS